MHDNQGTPDDNVRNPDEHLPDGQNRFIMPPRCFFKGGIVRDLSTREFFLLQKMVAAAGDNATERYVTEAIAMALVEIDGVSTSRDEVLADFPNWGARTATACSNLVNQLTGTDTIKNHDFFVPPPVAPSS